MPFVPQRNRRSLAVGEPPKTVGDECYQYYLPMIHRWRKERRWTTAHNLFKEAFNVNDQEAARTLAFLVFMIREVMPYEEGKAKENGEV